MSSSMLDILDGIRRVISKWVNTQSRITADIANDPDVTIGALVTVENTKRFCVGDNIFIGNGDELEKNLTIEKVESNTTLRLTTDVENITKWNGEYGDGNVVVIKAIHDHFVRGIHIGDPDVIPRFPAITVNGIGDESEWATLRVTKEKYDIEINTFVPASSHEDGYRFLLEITGVIKKGLKRNFHLVMNNFRFIELLQPISEGDTVIYVADRDTLLENEYLILEDTYDVSLHFILTGYEDSDPTAIHLQSPVCFDFEVSDTQIMVPNKYIHNSWPTRVDYGKIHKGELLKASTISFFAEEMEVHQPFNADLKIK